MNVTDPDWLAAFGTDSSEIEKPAKATKKKLSTHQHEARLIQERPELFSPNHQDQGTSDE